VLYAVVFYENFSLIKSIFLKLIIRGILIYMIKMKIKSPFEETRLWFKVVGL